MSGTLIRDNPQGGRAEQGARAASLARPLETRTERDDDTWHVAQSGSRAQVVLPRDRQGTTINIIWGDRDRLPDLKPQRMSGRLAFVFKALMAVAVVGAMNWGPSYYSCRQAKDRGMFYYGTTITSCMGERMDARNTYFETLGRKLIPAL